jgi:hypothetical protein
MRNETISTRCRDIQANAVGASLSSGYLRVYSTPKPESADAAAEGDPLATLRFANIAFNLAVDGRIISTPLIPDTNTHGGGDAVWFRASAESGEAIFDGTVGLADSDNEGNLNIHESLTVHPGGEFHVGSVAYRVAPKDVA